MVSDVWRDIDKSEQYERGGVMESITGTGTAKVLLTHNLPSRKTGSFAYRMSSPRRSWIHDLDHGSMTFFPESSVGSGEVPGGVQGNLG